MEQRLHASVRSYTLVTAPHDLAQRASYAAIDNIGARAADGGLTMSDPTTGRHSLGTASPPEEETSELHVGDPDAGELSPDSLASTEQLEVGESPEQDLSDTTEQARQVDEPPTRAKGTLSHKSGLWIGMTVCAVGFVAIIVGWNQVAGLTNVAEQVPFLISGGLVGLALVIVGATILDVTVRRQDTRERRRQLHYMTCTLCELRDLLEAEELLAADEYEREYREATV